MIRLEWRDLVVGYEGRAVRDIGTGMVTSERLNLVEGSNGSGKTTLLKTLAGILAPVQGTVVPTPDPALTTYLHSVPWLFRGTVRHNLSLAGRGAALEDEARLMGIDDLLESRVSRLSRGQAQRVALARAMLRRPGVLLLDEPEGSLDTDSRDRWIARIRQCVRDRSPLILLATHQRRDWDVPCHTLEL